MPPSRTVKGNRIVIDERVYETKGLGGGRFDVFKAGVRVGAFAVRGRAVEADDLHAEGADSIEEIGLLWVQGNLSARVEPRPVEPAPEPAAVAATEVVAATTGAAAQAAPASKRSDAPATVTWPTCRISTHDRPDAAAFKKALTYQAWLRTQPGVQAAYLTHDNATGKTVSVSIWATREQIAALRYAKPPRDAVPLKALTVEDLWVVG